MPQQRGRKRANAAAAAAETEQAAPSLLVCTVLAHYDGGHDDSTTYLNFSTRDAALHAALTTDADEERVVEYVLRQLDPALLPSLRSLTVTFFGERPHWLHASDDSGFDGRTVSYDFAPK